MEKATAIRPFPNILHHASMYPALKPVPKASNNLDVMDLQDAFENWRSLSKIMEKEAA
jgi:hypothetical protein